MEALLDAAAEWLRARGCDRMVGPMDFSMNDESGVLVEGFDLRADDPAALAPALLPARCSRRAGMTKAMDLYRGSSTIENRARRSARRSTSSPSKAARRARRSRPQDVAPPPAQGDATTSPRSTTPPGRRTGASSPTRRRTSTPTRSSCSSSSTRTGSWSPRADGEPVAIAITVIDINQVLARMNGRLLPLGWWHFLQQAGSATRSGSASSGSSPSTSTPASRRRLYIAHFDAADTDAPERRRGRLDPGDQRGDEPRPGRRWAARSSSATGSTSGTL